jgi:hypothetical protein
MQRDESKIHKRRYIRKIHQLYTTQRKCKRLDLYSVRKQAENQNNTMIHYNTDNRRKVYPIRPTKTNSILSGSSDSRNNCMQAKESALLW